MPTLNYPRRAMRPPADLDNMPDKCAWCKRKVGRGVVFTRGKDMGKDAIVCGECLTPPQLGERVSELSGAGEAA